MDAGPALAVVDVGGIARGALVCDVLVKRAPVRLLRADPVTPGKLAVVFAGGVAEVEEAFEAALQAAGADLLEELLLPQAHEALPRALEGEVEPWPGEALALGLLECAGVASTLAAADAALKAAETRLVALHLARGIGGKGYFALAGEQHDVEAALSAGEAAVGAERLRGRELLARPHGDLHFVLERLQGGL